MSRVPPKLTPEESAKVEELFRRDIALLLGRDDSQIRVKIFDPGMEGRSGMNIEAEPALSEAEEALVHRYIVHVSDITGSRPPLRGAKA